MTEPNRDLTSGFECNGYWWLDESPSNVVAGMFRFDPKEGCSIELLGNLGTHDFESGSVKIIRGMSSTNDRLTLLNCTPNNKQLQQGLFEINNLVCELALVGNYHPAKDLNFVKCSMRFDNLDSWVKSDYVKVDRRKAPWGARAHQGKINFPLLAAAFRCISKIGRRLRGMGNRVGPKRWGVALNSGGADGILGITVQAGRQGSLICKGAGFQANLEAAYVGRSGGRSIHLDAITSLHIEPESKSKS